MKPLSQSILLILVAAIAASVTPILLLKFTPLGRIHKNRKIKIENRLQQFKLKHQEPVELKIFPVQFLTLVTALGLMFGVPLVIAKLWGAVLPEIFHTAATVVFPLQGEYILMAVLFFVLGVGAMVIQSTLMKAFPKFGAYAAAEAIFRQLVFLGQATRLPTRQERHQLLEQIASDYDLRGYTNFYAKLHKKTLGLVTLCALPFFIWIASTSAQVTDQGVKTNTLSARAKSYTWDQVKEIEISVEDVGGQRYTTYQPTFTFFFTDGSELDVWGSSFTDITEKLIQTCTVARQHQVQIFVSPLAYGRLNNFNNSAKTRVERVLDSPECAGELLLF